MARGRSARRGGGREHRGDRAVRALPAGATGAARGPSARGWSSTRSSGSGTSLSAVAGYTSPEARAAFERAVTLAEGLENTIAIMPALWGAWAYWFVLGEHQIASALAERCVDDRRRGARTASASDCSRPQSTAISCSTSASSRARSRSSTGPPRLERRRSARGVPARPGDRRRRLARGGAVVRSATPTRAARSRAEAHERIQALDPAGRRTALTQCFAGMPARVAGRARRRSRWRRSSSPKTPRRSPAEHGYPTWVAAATMHRSIALCSLGRFDEGLPTLAAVVAGWRTAGQDASGRQLHPVLMTPYFAGRLAEAQLVDRRGRAGGARARPDPRGHRAQRRALLGRRAAASARRRRRATRRDRANEVRAHSEAALELAERTACAGPARRG